MRFRYLLTIFYCMALCMASWAYASEETYLYSIQDTASPDPKILEELTSPNSSTGVKKLVKESIDPRLTFRVVSEKELLRERDKDRELTLGRTWEILARVNNKATHYVTREIKSGSPMYVPNDFAAYKDWTPLPRQIEDLASVPKFILVVKDIPFLGWYEDGHLIGDSVVCVGKLGTWTRAGLYRVKTKDIDHVSRSYRNDYGMPSPMPYGLRVYGLVWIHGGDIASGYCSHGCINLPLRTAEEVFSWADHSTVVMIVESLNDLDRVMEKNRSNCTLFAQKCSPRRMGQARPTLVTADASQGLGEPAR